jgi:hypothetical protein
MKPITLGIIAIGAVLALAPGSVLGEPIEKKGTTPYRTHFVFRPLASIDIPGLGTATALERIRINPARIQLRRSSWRIRWA